MLGIYLPVYQNELAPSEKVMLIASKLRKNKKCSRSFFYAFLRKKYLYLDARTRLV